MLEGLRRRGREIELRSYLVSLWRQLQIRLHYIRIFLWPDVILLEGQSKSGQSLSILRAGIRDPQTAYFFAGQVFAELRSERALGRTWLWALPRLARKHSCGFVLFRVSRRWAPLARRILGRTDHDSLHLPVFVQATVDVSDRARLLRSRNFRDDVRRVGKRGFQFSVSRQKHDLDTFIREYHGPYVKRVHGFDAIQMDFSRLLASCAHGELPEGWVLLKVELNGEWVAGVLLRSGAGSAALMELGVKGSDLSLVKRGALHAAYWLSLEFLHSQGHKQVSLMHARPFLSNGVLQYKLKFSPFLKAARPGDGFLLFFNCENGAARETLLHEPLLVFNGDGLRAVWFSLHAAMPVDPSRIPIERLSTAGIKDVERLVLH